MLCNEELRFMKTCPRFERCSVPLCPLDPVINHRIGHPEDAKCSLPKTQRLKLGFDLPNRGLFPRELAGEKNWANRTVESRDQAVKNLVAGGVVGRFTPHVQTGEEANDK